jgi:hypothetical protein
MRKLILIASLSLFMACCILPPPVRAAVKPSFQTDATSPEDIKLLQGVGAAYLPYAKDLGCDRLVWADLSPDHTVMTFEYMPDDGLPVDDWKRLMTITLSPMYADAAKARQLMRRMIDDHLAVIGAHARVNASQVFDDSVNQAPALFIDYAAGAGAATEHDAGVFIRAAEHTAAFIQIQARGKKLDAADIAKIKSLLDGKAP